MGTDFAYTYANLTMGYHEITVYFIIRQIYALASKPFEKASFRYLGDCQILLKVNLITTDRLLSIKKTTSFSYYDKPKWYKNLNGCLQQSNRLKTICPTYVKPPTTFFNKYTVLF